MGEVFGIHGDTMVIALVSCGKSKLAHKAMACELYTGTLFKLSYEYAINNSDQVFILSAKHGLVHPNTRIEPYNETLNGKSKHDQKKWAYKVLQTLPKADHYIILAGENYRKYITQKMCSYEVPLEGLSFGHQLQRLKTLLKTSNKTKEQT